MKATTPLLISTTQQLADRARDLSCASDREFILAAVDFSIDSERALLQACTLADGLGVSVVVLHVIHDPAEMPGYYAKLLRKEGKIERIEDRATHAFGAFMDVLRDRHPGLSSLQKAELLMVVGLPVTRIIEVSEALQPTMLVVGSQGRTRLAQMLLGSKTLQIVQLCPVPVLVVKAQSEGTTP